MTETGRAVLMNVLSPHKWRFTLKSEVFGTSSSLPPLVSEGGGRVCESVSKADLMSDHFDSKQSREAVDLQLTCHPSDSLTTFGMTWRWNTMVCFQPPSLIIGKVWVPEALLCVSHIH